MKNLNSFIKERERIKKCITSVAFGYKNDNLPYQEIRLNFSNSFCTIIPIYLYPHTNDILVLVIRYNIFISKIIHNRK